MKMGLEELLSNREFEIGEKVYLNLPDSDPWVIYAYVVYSTHIEYMLRGKEGIMQIEGSSIVADKIF